MTTWPTGVRCVTIETVDSTNAEARRRAPADPGPLWITARRQTAGIGRQGRAWSSPDGNLAASLLLPFDGTLGEAATLGFHTGLAVADTLSLLAPGVPVAVKWPNDVLLDGKKASGILIETLGPLPDGRLSLVIGIGLNLAAAPPAEQTRWPATSVAALTGQAPDPDAALGLLANAVAARLAAGPFAAIRDAWLARAARLGDEIDVRLPTETLRGRFDDVAPDGALILGLPGGATRRILAADIFFPEAADAARH